MSRTVKVTYTKTHGRNDNLIENGTIDAGRQFVDVEYHRDLGLMILDGPDVHYQVNDVSFFKVEVVEK